MWIIADSRMPGKARNKLEKMGTVLWITPQKFIYPAISAHPDIFFCQIDHKIITAPNAPKEITGILKHNNIPVIQGKKSVGLKHPETVYYNAVVTKSLLIHNSRLSDETLLAHSGNRKIIHTTQGYTRCNLIELYGYTFLTSDKNIEKKLLWQGLEVLFIDPVEILLPGVKHGFIGGCCGVFENKLVVIGSFRFHSQEKKIKNFILDKNMEIIELYDGPLWDGGGILFLQQS